jgi:hypothetical protein
MLFYVFIILKFIISALQMFYDIVSWDLNHIQGYYKIIKLAYIKIFFGTLLAW